MSRPRISVLLRVVIGVALLIALVLGAGPDAVVGHLRRLDLLSLALAAGLYACSLAIRGLRVWVLLQPEHPKGNWGITTCASTLGWSLNNFLPFRLGDLLRIYLLGIRSEVPLASVLLAVVAERLLDVAFLALTTAGGSSPQLVMSGIGPALGGAIVVAIALALALFGLVRGRWRGWAGGRYLPARLEPLRARAAGFIASAKLAARTHLTGGGLLRLLGLTAAAWAGQFLQYAMFFNAFGIELSPLLLAGFAAFMLSFAVNFVPGQVGTYEALFVGIFASAGVGAPDLLLAIALATHVVNGALLSLFGAASYLYLGVRHGELRELLASSREQVRLARGEQA